MIDYEVYGYADTSAGAAQTMEIVSTFAQARKEMNSMRKSGLVDIRAVKHDMDDEATAFYEFRNGKITRVE